MVLGFLTQLLIRQCGELKEEKVRALEEKYGIHRGERIIIQEPQETRDETGRKKKDKMIDRHMKVVDLYRNFILLEDKRGSVKASSGGSSWRNGRGETHGR